MRQLGSFAAITLLTINNKLTISIAHKRNKNNKKTINLFLYLHEMHAKFDSIKCGDVWFCWFQNMIGGEVSTYVALT